MTTAYLDNNATTPIHPAVIEAVAQAMAQEGNPSSVHGAGRAVRAKVEDAREAVASLIKGPASGVIFTSGGTEANALALIGSAKARVLVSAVEHPAVLNARADVEIIPVDDQGLVDLAALEKMLIADDRPALVSVMAANNETGALQPIRQVVELAHAHGAWMHCDAVQAVGKVPFDMTDLGCDLVSISAHKIGGPHGVGALVKRDKLPLQAVQKGGGQERSFRGGTENVAGIIGFGVAAKLAEDKNADNLLVLRDQVIAYVKDKGATVFSEATDRLPNTVCFALEGLRSERQVMALDLAGVMVSAGSACSSGTVKPSHVLQAMGIADDLASCAIRVSFGWRNTAQDVERFMKAWSALADRVLKKQGGGKSAA